MSWNLLSSQRKKRGEQKKKIKRIDRSRETEKKKLGKETLNNLYFIIELLIQRHKPSIESDFLSSSSVIFSQKKKRLN